MRRRKSCSKEERAQNAAQIITACVFIISFWGLNESREKLLTCRWGPASPGWYSHPTTILFSVTSQRHTACFTSFLIEINLSATFYRTDLPLFAQNHFDAVSGHDNVDLLFLYILQLEFIL